MRELLVSIDICSSSHSLSELSLMTGIQAGGSSHDKDAPCGKCATWTESILRIESKVNRNATIADHLQELLLQFDHLNLRERLAGKNGVYICLNVAVMFDTANVSLEIDDNLMLAIGEKKMKLEFAAYPSTEN